MDNDEVIEEGTVTTGEPSLRDALEASYEAAEKAAPEAAEPASPTPATPTGKAPASAETAGDPGTAAATSVTSAAPSDNIPQRLQSKFPAEKWAALPSEVKAEFAEYESNIGRLASKYGKDAAAWQDAQQLMAPYREMIQAEGGDYRGVMSGMLETARILRQGTPDQKLGLIHYMAQRFAIPISRAEDGTIILPNPRTPPETLARLTQLEARDLTTRGMVDHNVRQEVSTELETFLADPLHQYSKEPGYLDMMANMIRTGQAKDLQDAYQQSAWLHANTRPLEIAKANQAAVAPRVAQAARARQAAVSVNGNAPGAMRADTSKMSLRDTLEAAWDGDLDS